MGVLAKADGAIEASNRHGQELEKERKRLDLELEFFKNDPARIPAKLKRQIEQNANDIEEQKRFVLAQQEEKRRINLRFDEELAKLKQLWAQRAAPVTSKPRAAASGSATAKAASSAPARP
jgi:TolA-binding protein